MAEIYKLLESPAFWFSTLAMGIAVNLLSDLVKVALRRGATWGREEAQGWWAERFGPYSFLRAKAPRGQEARVRSLRRQFIATKAATWLLFLVAFAILVMIWTLYSTGNLKHGVSYEMALSCLGAAVAWKLAESRAYHLEEAIEASLR